jgi:hypothetical protein
MHSIQILCRIHLFNARLDELFTHVNDRIGHVTLGTELHKHNIFGQAGCQKV